MSSSSRRSISPRSAAKPASGAASRAAPRRRPGSSSRSADSAAGVSCWAASLAPQRGGCALRPSSPSKPRSRARRAISATNCRRPPRWLGSPSSGRSGALLSKSQRQFPLRRVPPRAGVGGGEAAVDGAQPPDAHSRQAFHCSKPERQVGADGVLHPHRDVGAAERLGHLLHRERIDRGARPHPEDVDAVLQRLVDVLGAGHLHRHGQRSSPGGRAGAGSPAAPTPSKQSGRVRGFQMPARNAATRRSRRSRRAVRSTCASVSALQGPAMTYGRPLSQRDGAAGGFGAARVMTSPPGLPRGGSRGDRRPRGVPPRHGRSARPSPRRGRRGAPIRGPRERRTRMGSRRWGATG